MSDQTKRICILGGGFGGLYTALRLDSLPWDNSPKPEIVLIDKNDRFLFLPLLYELVTEELQSWEIAPPFEELLAHTSVRFVQTRVTGIDVEDKQVHLENQPALSYDRLVVALGGKTPLNIVPGAQEYAIPFHSLSDAYRLVEKLRALENSELEKIRIAVVGGGYSGVELACKLADRLGQRGRLRVVERGTKLLEGATGFNRNSANKALSEKQVWLDLETTVELVTKDSISLQYKGEVDTIPVDLVLWTVGTKVSELVKSLPLKHNEEGLLITNALLQAQGYEEIFALGDLADCTDAQGNKIPATAQSAFQQADYCAWNIWASLTNRPLLPFQYQHLGEMMALGTDGATIAGMGIKLDGSLAYLARRLIYLYRLPTLKHQLTVGLNWLSAPFLDR